MSEVKQRIAAYCRVSSNSAEQETSFDNQKRAFEQKAKNEGLELVRTYADKGLTGTQVYNRPELELMLKHAGIDKIVYVNPNDRNDKNEKWKVSKREPHFNEIWLSNTSRLGRNASETNNIIESLDEKGINCKFIAEGINSNDPNQKVPMKFFQVLDEQDSRSKGPKVFFGKKASADKGKIFSNHKFFGYRFEPHNNKLVIVTQEAAIVAELFELYAAGIGCRRIESIFIEKGYCTRENKPFSRSTLSKMLTNEKYAGYNNPLKWDKGSVFKGNRNAKIRPGYKIEKHKGIQPIVSWELFEKCQSVRKGNINYQKSKGKYNGLTEYKGLIFCGQCGWPYYADIDKNRRFYKCANKKRNGIKACDNPNIGKSVLYSYLNVFLDGGYLRFKEYEIQKAQDKIGIRIMQLYGNLDSSRNIRAAELQKEISKLKEVQREQYKILQTAEYKETAIEEINRIDKLLAKTQADYELAVLDNNAIMAEIKRLSRFSAELNEMLSEDIPESIDALLYRIDKIIIYKKETSPGYNISTPLKFPYELRAILDKELELKRGV